MRSRYSEWLINGGLVVCSILFTWLAIEAAVWAFFPEERDKILANMISADRRGTLTEGWFRNIYTYDPLYGWLPIADFIGQKWGHRVALEAHGIRSNGAVAHPDERPLILAVGDSYTFGDEVADHETWPAIFQKKTGVRTLNAGVSSFGVDQIVMRAEELAAIYKPDVISLTFISGSQDRAGYSVRHGAYKPYFDLIDDQLILRNHPVPRQDQIEWWRYLLGHSYVLHFPMHRFAPAWWWRGAMWDFREAGNDPVHVSCKLVERLRNYAATQRMALGVLFLIEGDPRRSNPSFEPFRRCVQSLSGVAVADTQSFYEELYRQDAGLKARLHNPPPDSHFTAAGNAIVAEQQKNLLLPLLPKDVQR